jgi:hypothetical protein
MLIPHDECWRSCSVKELQRQTMVRSRKFCAHSSKRLGAHRSLSPTSGRWPPPPRERRGLEGVGRAVYTKIIWRIEFPQLTLQPATSAGRRCPKGGGGERLGFTPNDNHFAPLATHVMSASTVSEILSPQFIRGHLDVAPTVRTFAGKREGNIRLESAFVSHVSASPQYGETAMRAFDVKRQK